MRIDRVVDITGRDFNMLHVVGLDHCENRRSYWLCRCECGNTVVLRKSHFAYRGSKQVSCGCYRNKKSSERMKERHQRRRSA